MPAYNVKSVYCPRCGARQAAPARFCLMCGANLTTGVRAADTIQRRVAIEVISGLHAGERWDGERRVVDVGRREPSDLLLPKERFVSAAHCRFSIRGDELWVEDLDTANGTFVGGRRVGAARLTSGDVVQCGQGGPELIAALHVEITSGEDAGEPDVGPSSAVEVDVPARVEPRPRWVERPAPAAPGGDTSTARGSAIAAWFGARAAWVARLRGSFEGTAEVGRSLTRFVLRMTPLLVFVVMLVIGSQTIPELRRRAAAAYAGFQTEREIRRMTGVVAVAFRVDEELPSSLRVFLSQSFEGAGDKPPWQDYFGSDYVLEPTYAQRQPGTGTDVLVGFVLSSPGPDRIRGTDDDIVSPYRSPNWESRARVAP